MADLYKKDIELFREYCKVITLPSLEGEKQGDPKLIGKKLGMVNGSFWVGLWANYFSSKILPGVKRLNVGNDAIQYNFMRAHQLHEECPPQSNKELIALYAQQLHHLYAVDAIICTCSTMNRSYPYVEEAMKPYGLPVVQIDIPMMEAAARIGGKILVIATHGPTVESTQLLLRETAQRLKTKLCFDGDIIPSAFEMLARGKIEEHNELIAQSIRKKNAQGRFNAVVLAQLSMTVFKLSYPNCEKEFGVPVLTSGECGFERIREIFLGKEHKGLA